METPDRSRPDARLALAVGSARAVSRLSRWLHVGGGTAAPGRVASALEPAALEKLARRFGDAVVVAGTNGKTTTSRLVADVVAASGRPVVHNRAGANLTSGIVATLAGSPRRQSRTPGAVAVLETDEAALPEVLSRVRPSVVVLTNLFRDQLDRYGETDLIVRHWRDALTRLPSTTRLVVCGDDPSLVALTADLPADRVLFGIDESIYQLAEVPHAAEVIGCPACGSPVAYHGIFVGHLGQWHCPACGHGRPTLEVAASAVELWSHEFQSLKVSGPEGVRVFEAALPGLYNTYNLLAALAAARVLDVPDQVSQRALAAFRGAFGRAEQVVVRGRSLMVMLVKNPVGTNEVLRTLNGVDRPLEAPVLFCLNDRASDGRDVSWIWDVDYESLASTTAHLYCAGRRWADIGNRLHYAGVSDERLHGLGPDLGSAVDRFVDAIPAGGRAFVLPTYSALLELRAVLAERGKLTAFWAE